MDNLPVVQPKIKWSQDMDDRLMELISLDWTFGQIAMALVVSKDAVSGRFSRLRKEMGWQAS